MTPDSGLPLRKCRTCKGCRALETRMPKRSHWCSLGFNLVDHLVTDGGGRCWFVAKPAEPCLKPRTNDELLVASRQGQEEWNEEGRK